MPSIALNKSAFDGHSERSEEPAFSQKSKKTIDSSLPLAPRNDNREGFFNKRQGRSRLDAREPKDRRMDLSFECPSDRLRIFYQRHKILVD